MFHKESFTFRGQSEVCRLTLEVQGGSNISPKKPKASASAQIWNRQGTRAALLASFRRRSKSAATSHSRKGGFGEALRLKDSPCCLGRLAVLAFSVLGVSLSVCFSGRGLATIKGMEFQVSHRRNECVIVCYPRSLQRYSYWLYEQNAFFKIRIQMLLIQ